MIDPALGTLLAFAFALLFASAAFHKARALAHFAETLRAYRVLPAGLPLSGLVPLAELAVAVGLLVTTTHAAAAVAGAALLLVYAAAIALNLARGRRDLACGCGGPDDRRPIAPWMVLRNVLLAVALGAVALPWTTRRLEAADFLTLVGGLVITTLLYMSAERLLGRVLPRTALWGEPR